MLAGLSLRESIGQREELALGAKPKEPPPAPFRRRLKIRQPLFKQLHRQVLLGKICNQIFLGNGDQFKEHEDKMSALGAVEPVLGGVKRLVVGALVLGDGAAERKHRGLREQ